MATETVLDIERIKNNPNSKVMIRLNDKSLVTAFLTEDFGMSAGAEYNAESENLLNSMNVKGVNAQSASSAYNTGVNVVNNVAGTNFAQRRIASPVTTIYSWMSSNRMSFTIPLFFIAVNPNDDPRDPVRQLLRAVNPTFDNQALSAMTAPNNYSGSPKAGESSGLVSFQIGRWFSTEPLFVVRNIDPVFSKAVTRRNVPLYASCSVQLDAYRMLSADEIDRFFVSL